MVKYSLVFDSDNDKSEIIVKYDYTHMVDDENEQLISKLKEEIRDIRNINRKYDYKMIFENENWKQVKGNK